uniref:Uncharacterized protein n=1 Tax=Manihot esculenta TaxID=3983 RepID=A0A2C9U1Z8_MANES
MLLCPIKIKHSKRQLFNFSLESNTTSKKTFVGKQERSQKSRVESAAHCASLTRDWSCVSTRVSSLSLRI